MMRKLLVAATAVICAGIGLADAAQAKEKVVICALTFVSSSPLFIAMDRGYYEAEGLEAEIKFFNAAQPVAVAIASGDCDYGVTGFTAGFFNLAGRNRASSSTPSSPPTRPRTPASSR
jgi:NitT/TauT family transport system substrate-binding protein